MAVRSGAGCVLYSANSDITKPGVQNPHCEPCPSAIARCTGWSAPVARSLRLSTVNSARLSRVGTNWMQELIDR
jgi:hypothetical protein